jgi:hypothetical protein
VVLGVVAPGQMAMLTVEQEVALCDMCCAAFGQPCKVDQPYSSSTVRLGVVALHKRPCSRAVGMAIGPDIVVRVQKVLTGATTPSPTVIAALGLLHITGWTYNYG